MSPTATTTEGAQSRLGDEFKDPKYSAKITNMARDTIKARVERKAWKDKEDERVKNLQAAMKSEDHQIVYIDGYQFVVSDESKLKVTEVAPKQQKKKKAKKKKSRGRRGAK